MANSRPTLNRRRFAGLFGLLGAGAVTTAALPAAGRNVIESSSHAASVTPDTDDAHHMDGKSTPPPADSSTDLTADQMDAMHEAGIRAFPAKTKGLGGQPLPYVVENGVKVFHVTCKIVDWEYEPGKSVQAWTYNGVVPGPEIRVTEGDRIQVVVKNELPESTSIHWHGLMVPNNQDGVPFMTQPPIKPGETFTYEFPIRHGNAGSHMYHAHANSAFQVTSGLLGPFIVEPSDPKSRPAFDREYTIVLNDGPIGGFSLNGKSFPATQPLHAKKGERVLIRYMNEGLMIHPMHLHGMPMTIVAQDGYLLPQPYMCDTLNIAPGQRFEAIVHATEVGTWAFHCHILAHAESAHGMFGMTTAMIVEA